uniref:Mitochondrial carrier protein n=1 Tax=Parascaris univalens TaxID=6257 RepID=A0A914ZT29_PARUN
MDKEAFIHFIGGALGGTAGTAITCPLEVVKTRLQSSHYAASTGGPSTSKESSTLKGISRTQVHSRHISRQNFGRYVPPLMRQPSKLPSGFIPPASLSMVQRVSLHAPRGVTVRFWQRKNIFKLFHHIIVNEGVGALYKGLGPNLIGVAPSKAVYFYTYSSCKRFWNGVDIFVPNSAIVHMLSAACAGFVAATVVNPIWLVKTRLQLHKGPLTITECIKRVFRNEGIKGFYRGVTASYMGISETVIQFVLYEHVRSHLVEAAAATQTVDEDRRKKVDFINFMLAGGTAKFFACVAAYPHEVVRTRLREEHTNARGFFSTLFSIYRLEGFRALYRGLAVQLMRTVPNTAITMGTYEVVVYVLHRL